IHAPSEEMFAEQLFVIAEDLGRERRSVRFALSKDLGYKSWRVAWFPGGEKLAILRDYGGTVQILDAELKPAGEHHGDQVNYFAVDPQGRSLAYNQGPREVVIVGRETGHRVSIAVRDTPILACSPDGRLIATGGYGREVDMWSATDGASVRRFQVEGTDGG